MLNVTPSTAEVLLKLAQRHYVARLAELKRLISAEEAKFKCVPVSVSRIPLIYGKYRSLVTEIDEIRGGLWDDKIMGKHAENAPSAEQSLVPVQDALHDDVSHGITPSLQPAVSSPPSAKEEAEVPKEIVSVETTRPVRSCVQSTRLCCLICFEKVVADTVLQGQNPATNAVRTGPVAPPEPQEEEEEEEPQVIDLTADVAARYSSISLIFILIIDQADGGGGGSRYKHG